MRFSPLVIFWTLWFLNFSSRTVLSPLLPIIEDEAVLSHAQAGSLFTFLSLGYTIMLVSAGLLSPWAGYKRSIAGGFLILAAGIFSLRYSRMYLPMVMSVLVIGIGAGLYMPSIIPMITSIFRREKWGRVISIHSSAAGCCVFAVPLLVALGLRFLEWRSLLSILGGACIIATAFFWIFTSDVRPQKEPGVSLFSVMRRLDFWIIAFVWTLAVCSGLGIYSVTPLFLVKERGLSMELANSVFGVSRVGGLLFIILAGFLADRYGAKRVLFLVILLTGLCTIGLAMVRTFPLLVTMLVAQGTLCTGFFPVGHMIVSGLTTLRERSIFVGGVLAIGGICGAGLTPVGLGAIADVRDFQSGILVVGVIGCLSCLSLRGLQREMAPATST